LRQHIRDNSIESNGINHIPKSEYWLRIEPDRVEPGALSSAFLLP